MALAKINGRDYFFDAGKVEIESNGSGRWIVKVWTWHSDRNGAEDFSFDVIGGRKSGGASNEWFTHRPEMFGEQWLPAKSMKEAIERGVCY